MPSHARFLISVPAAVAASTCGESAASVPQRTPVAQTRATAFILKFIGFIRQSSSHVFCLNPYIKILKKDTALNAGTVVIFLLFL